MMRACLRVGSEWHRDEAASCMQVFAVKLSVNVLCIQSSFIHRVSQSFRQHWQFAQ